MQNLEFEVEGLIGRISHPDFIALASKKYDEQITFNAEIIAGKQPVDVSILIYNEPEFLIQNNGLKLWIQITGCNPTMISKGQTITFTGKISAQKPLIS
jgi:hypothetical protein